MPVRFAVLAAFVALAACVPTRDPEVDDAPPVDGGGERPDAGGPDAGPDHCGEGLRECAGGCFDPRVEHEHCGRCGNACLATEICSEGACLTLPADCRESGCPGGYWCDFDNGQCKPGCYADGQCPQPGRCDLATHECRCAEGTHRCAGRCAASDAVTSCGDACSPCPDDPRGSPTCSQGTCGITCDPENRLCDGACAACPTQPAVTATTCAGGACVAASCRAGSRLCGRECAACPAGAGIAETGCSGQTCVPTRCAAGYRICGGACVACPAGDAQTSYECNGAACVISSCGSGRHTCNGACVSNAAVATCGSSCTPCAGDPNGNATCDGSACGLACRSGSRQCGGACATCPTSAHLATTACDGARCTVATCEAGYHLCGGVCVSNRDVATCGTRCDACPTTGGTATCTADGRCSMSSCQDGWKLCGAACSQCPTGPHLALECSSEGRCAGSCAAGFHDCAGSCVSDDSPATCGTRCTACPSDPNGLATCDYETCGLECRTDSHLCAGACAACPATAHVATTTCSAAGACVPASCDAGFLLCGTSCATCPARPGGTFACSGAQCVVTGCAVGFRPCDGGCCPWTVSLVARGAHGAYGPRLRVTPTGGVHLAFTTVGSDFRASANYGRWVSNAYAEVTTSAYPAKDLGVTPNDLFRLLTVAGDGKLHVRRSSSGSGDRVGSALDSWQGAQGSVLAVDSGNNPRVAFHLASGGYYQSEFQLTRFNGSSWATVPVEVTPGAIYGTLSLALDATDAEHFAMRGGANGSVRYVRSSANGWVGVDVDPSVATGRPALALDSAGRAHFAWQEESSRALRYARPEGTGWVVSTVTGDAGAVSLALDSAGRPHLAYGVAGELRHARWSGTEWVVSTVATASGSVAETALRLGRSDEPHVLFGWDGPDSYDGTVSYAR